MNSTISVKDSIPKKQITVASLDLCGSFDKNNKTLESYISKNVMADVWCFQGCTKNGYEALVRLMRQYGFKYEKNTSLETSTFDMIFTSGGFTDVNFYPFKKSKEGRGLSVISMENIVIANTSLEKETVGNRTNQFVEISTLLTQPFILAINTNLPNFQDTFTTLPSGWQDSWIVAGKQNNGKNRGNDRPFRIYFSGVEILDFNLIEYENKFILTGTFEI